MTESAAPLGGTHPLAPAIPASALEPVDCGLCGCEERELRFQDGPFQVVECSACALVYVTPRLKDSSLIDHVYNETYWSSDAAKVHGYTDYRADAPLYKRTYEKRLSVLERHFPGLCNAAGEPLRVLDVGCAAGYFLAVMQARGCVVTGLEPSATIREVASVELGAGCVHGELLAIDDTFEPGSFDLITFWDVIEHIPDPRKALARARELLAPGGRLLVETQNVDSRAAKLLGKKWQHYKHAEHIYHFTPRTLERLFAEAGFEVLENTPRLGGKYVSLAFVTERAGRLHPAFSFLLSPLRLIGGTAVYINLMDEMIVVGAPADGHKQGPTSEHVTDPAR